MDISISGEIEFDIGCVKFKMSEVFNGQYQIDNWIDLSGDPLESM